MAINFNNKTFSLINNSEEGEVDKSVKFEYKQDGNVVTADYHGGTIVYGKIIANHKGDHLDMLYQCITTDGELRAGKAIAHISLSDTDKIKLQLNWEWINGGSEKGESQYLED